MWDLTEKSEVQQDRQLRNIVTQLTCLTFLKMSTQEKNTLKTNTLIPNIISDTYFSYKIYKRMAINHEITTFSTSNVVVAHVRATPCLPLLSGTLH